MVRVLHVFAPSLGKTFSGDNKWWVRTFSQLNCNHIRHKILFPETGKIVDSATPLDGFGSVLSGSPYKYPRWRRAVWILQLLGYLLFYRNYYDIIHVHVQNWGGLLIGPYSKLLRRPSVRSIVRMGGDDPSTIRQNSLGAIKFWCFKKYDQVICISKALRDDCLQNGLNETKVHLLPNSVDTNLFIPVSTFREKILLRQKLGLPENAEIILFVGSVIHRKGADLLTDAFLFLAKDHPEFYILFVGPASKVESIGIMEDFVEELQVKIASAGYSGQVAFAGRIDDDKILADYYRAADIFVFPTRLEGLGYVLLEAMSSGLPVIASLLPGVTDMIVIDGFGGFLVKAEDKFALAEKILFFLNNVDQRHAFGEKARAWVLEKFSFKTYQNKLHQVYNLMID